MSYDVDHTFIDKKGRKINFQVHVDVIAHVQGKEVGHVQFDFDEFSSQPYLFHMFVDSSYGRAGIGTEMIRLAAEVHGRQFGRPSFFAQGGSGKSSSEYFTQDGAALIQHCVALDIIDDITDFEESPDDDFYI